MRYLVAIDGGGSSTQCVIVNEAGELLGRGVGPAVVQIVEPEGEKICRLAILEALQSALGVARLTTSQIDLACLGMSGLSTTMNSVIRETLASIPDLLIVHDTLTALAGAHVGDPGIVVIAGTGSVAYGTDRLGNTARVGGWGHYMGDEGSAYWIGRRALSLATRSADGVTTSTCLEALVPEKLGCAHLCDLHQQLHAGLVDRPSVAALTEAVVYAAEAGDRASIDLLGDAGVALGRLALTVTRKLGVKDARCSYVGGVFRAGEWILEPFSQEIHKGYPEVRLSAPAMDCLGGAILLGLRHAGISVDSSVLRNIHATLQ